MVIGGMDGGGGLSDINSKLQSRTRNKESLRGAMEYPLAGNFILASSFPHISF